jgi:hypothetical protein
MITQIGDSISQANNFSNALIDTRRNSGLLKIGPRILGQGLRSVMEL